MEKLTLKEYQHLAQRTNAELGDFRGNLNHMLLGLNSEFNELYDATEDVNRAEEITDYLWYLVNYATMRKIDLWRVTEFVDTYYILQENDDYIGHLQRAVSVLTDLEKKEYVYKKMIPRETLINAVTDILERINDCYVFYAMSPEESMARNISKLQIRFPEKFTEHNATNRDLESEYKALSGENK